MIRRTLAGLLLGASLAGSCLAQGGGPANTIPFGQGAGRSFGFAGPCLAGVPLIGAGVGSPPTCHSAAMSTYAPITTVAPNVFPIDTANCSATAASECTDLATKITACEASTGGGEIVFPKGQFLLNAGYTISGACTIRGQGWKVFSGTGTTFTIPDDGTYLKQTTTANTMFTFVLGSNGAMLRDLAITQTQPASAPGFTPIAYPPVIINKTGGTSFDRVLLFGVTKGMQFGTTAPEGSGHVFITNSKAVCFTWCYHTVFAGDGIRLINTEIHSGFIGSLNTDMLTYIQTTSVAVKSDRSDGGQIRGLFIYGYFGGVDLSDDGGNGTTVDMDIVDYSCDQCTLPFLIRGATSTNAIRLANLRFAGTGTTSRGIQCAAPCTIQVTNYEVLSVRQSAVWCETTCEVQISNFIANTCNIEGSHAPIRAQNVTGIIRIGGGYRVDGGNCFLRNGTPGIGRISLSSPIGPETVGNLPTCAAVWTGVEAYVTDSNVTAWGATLAGGGASTVRAWCNGTAWKIIGSTVQDAGGDVVGPASATDNAVALFNGTGGKTIKNSGVTVSTGAITGTSINFGGSTLSNYTEGSWTPTDSSGGGLSFSGVSANYTRIGRMVFAYATVTWPATADANPAIIGGLPVTTANSNFSRQCSLTTSSESTLVHMIPAPNATTISLQTSSAVALTNATMSGDTIYFICIYPAS